MDDLEWLQTHPVQDEDRWPEVYTPSGEPPDPETKKRLWEVTADLRTGARLTRASDVRPEPTKWLWERRIPYGKLTVLDGHPGQGKSTLTMALAAAVSTGSPLPQSDTRRHDPCGVVVLSAEDGVADTIVPRLLAHGADLDRVVALDAVAGDYSQPDRPWVLPGDIEILRAVIAEVDARLVIIDPLMAFLSGERDSHKDQDVRRALHPLSMVASDTGAAILIVRHLKKGEGLAIERGGGSIGISGAARSVMLIGTDPNDEEQRVRVLAPVKNNLAPMADSLAFHLEPVPEFGCAALHWDGVSPHTAETVLHTIDPEDVQEVGRAGEFLKTMLRQGPQPVTQILQQSKKHGIPDKFLARARRMLGVKDVEIRGVIHWALTAWSQAARLTEWQVDNGTDGTVEERLI